MSSDPPPLSSSQWDSLSKPQWPIPRSFINSPANINNNVVLVIGHGTTAASNVSFSVQFSFFHDTFFMESSSAHSRVFRHIFTSIPSRHISFRHGNVSRESLVVWLSNYEQKTSYKSHIKVQRSTHCGLKKQYLGLIFNQRESWLYKSLVVAWLSILCK